MRRLSPREHRCARDVANLRIVEHDQRRPQLFRIWKIEDHGGIFHAHVDRLQFSERLETALRLARRVCLVAPAIDIGLQLLGLRLLLGTHGFGFRLAFAPLPHELIVVAGIERKHAPTEMQNVIGDGVQ